MKKRTLRSNQETDEGKRCAALANSLTKKTPYKGLGADSEEKHEPVSDIDTAMVVDSRFNDFLAHLDVPKAILSTRLEKLVASGVLRKRKYGPRQYDYLLTERGTMLF